MADLFHYYGYDIVLTPAGDLQTVDGTVLGQQRVLRRLLTNAQVTLPDGEQVSADYIFHTDYGAGVPVRVGQVSSPDDINSLITGQMLLEDAVAQIPAPVVSTSPITGGVDVDIQYVDAPTQQQVALSFGVNT